MKTSLLNDVDILFYYCFPISPKIVNTVRFISSNILPQKRANRYFKYIGR